MNTKIRAIITGATGMVGEGVLYECIQHSDVEAVLVIGRKSCDVKHPKLKEIIHGDFCDLSAIENQLSGYNACFFCLGTSSINMREAEFYKITYTITMHVAKTLCKLNADMTFCYISGQGTNSTENGSMMWARVKGKTENDLMKLAFRQVYNFRPAYIHPTKGLKNTLRYYKYLSWLYPLLHMIMPKYIITLKELALAMINSVSKGYEKKVLEVRDIIALSK